MLCEYETMVLLLLTGWLSIELSSNRERLQPCLPCRHYVTFRSLTTNHFVFLFFALSYCTMLPSSLITERLCATWYPLPLSIGFTPVITGTGTVSLHRFMASWLHQRTALIEGLERLPPRVPFHLSSTLLHRFNPTQHTNNTTTKRERMPKKRKVVVQRVHRPHFKSSRHIIRVVGSSKRGEGCGILNISTIVPSNELSTKY
jgi:hypothetical protein